MQHIPSLFAFVVASLAALSAYSCGSAGPRLLPDVVQAGWARRSSAAPPTWHARSSELRTHREAFAEHCSFPSPGSLWVSLALHSSSHADYKVKAIVYWLVYVKDSFASGLRVTHITAKYVYFCRTKNARVPVADSTGSTLFKNKL